MADENFPLYQQPEPLVLSEEVSPDVFELRRARSNNLGEFKLEKSFDNYEIIAASQSNVNLGSPGAAGDVVHTLLVIPLTVAPGAVTIKEFGGSTITIFVGGTVADVKPFNICLNMKSTSARWQVSTGANVGVVAVGNFS